MNKIVRALCLALYPAVASATNFEACINDAKQNNNVTTASGYTSYKCDGTTAEKLSARPDECPAGNVRPPFSTFNRKQKQLDDGLLMALSWTAGKCAGVCETRSYDSKDTTYNCEVRVYNDDAKSPDARPPDANHARPPDRQTTDEPARRRPHWRFTHQGPPRYLDRPGYGYRPPYYSGRPDYHRRPPYYSDRADYPHRPPYADRRRYHRPPYYSDRPDYSNRLPYYPNRPPAYADLPDYPDQPPFFTRLWPDHPVPPEDVPPSDWWCWR